MKYFFLFCFLLSAFFVKAQIRSLAYYTEQAKKNSPLLKAYQNQSLSARIDSQLLLATLKPQVNFISSDMYAPIVRGWGYDNAITNTANLSGIFQARKDFISRAYLSSLQKSISLQTLSIQDTAKITEQELARTIADQYITAYGDMLTLDFATEIYNLLKKEEQALKDLTRANIFKQTDYLNFVVTMQQQELNAMQSQIAYNADFLLLNYLAGLNDTTVARLEEPGIADSLLPDLSNSVFYRRYTTDSLRIANEHSLVDFSYKPKISAFTDAGYNSSLQYAPYKNFGFSAGLGLVVPLYDGRQKAMKHARLDIEEKNRKTERDFFTSQYNQQIAQLYQQLRSTSLLVEKINQQLVFTNTLITADLKLLETGDIRITDLVLAINNYFTTGNLLRQNNIARLKIINQINYWNR
jgi:23S rRNA U2552 (ribose-2'-O)-methylase RlmE/FtsJ